MVDRPRSIVQGLFKTVRADLEQLLFAARSLPEGVVILASDDRILWLNDAASRHLGISRERDTGQFIHYLLRNARFGEWLALEDDSEHLTFQAPGALRSVRSPWKW